ncbi:Malonate decarboxylase acyl carrier protein [uncultured Alphaproteobacteria bacterium]|uniref:Malonate decarboxylase acyl carrier protein n=1 Tax=uncultured Alphaproteobacteria bacterium TaxID=91750 RepID=A0A212K4G7_9PROT|nr:Malonate decarboxylase acyl carrier protein [uncultured Alphaproteobacteria bacterium]
MALNTLEFECKCAAPAAAVAKPVHFGVVGSGDLEVLMSPAPAGGAVKVKVVTPVTGFDALWQRVLAAFVEQSKLGDVAIEINDNNATPAVVTLRLRQALAEAAA